MERADFYQQIHKHKQKLAEAIFEFVDLLAVGEKKLHSRMTFSIKNIFCSQTLWLVHFNKLEICRFSCYPNFFLSFRDIFLFVVYLSRGEESSDA